MEIGWLMFGFFVFVTLIFVAIAFFLPEWVGITGKKAQEYMKEQAGEQGKAQDKVQGQNASKLDPKP